MKSKPGKQHIYDGYGNGHTKHVQKTQESKHIYKPAYTKNDRKSEPEKQQIYDCYGHRRAKEIQTTVESNH